MIVPSELSLPCKPQMISRILRFHGKCFQNAVGRFIVGYGTVVGVRHRALCPHVWNH